MSSTIHGDISPESGLPQKPRRKTLDARRSRAASSEAGVYGFTASGSFLKSGYLAGCLPVASGTGMVLGVMMG